jgi:hypothetical protein
VKAKYWYNNQAYDKIQVSDNCLRTDLGGRVLLIADQFLSCLWAQPQLRRGLLRFYWGSLKDVLRPY